MKTEIRCLWAYDHRRPHAYIHATCTHRMKVEDGTAASALLAELIIPEGPHAVALRKDQAAASALLAKRLPQAHAIILAKSGFLSYIVYIHYIYVLHVRNDHASRACMTYIYIYNIYIIYVLHVRNNHASHACMTDDRTHV